MPRRALVERRPWLLGSLAAAIVYAFLRDGATGGVYLIGWKGAAVGLLAIYAVLRHRSIDARLLAGALAISAAADMAFELYPAVAVLLSFAAQMVLLSLLLRNRREALTPSQKGAATAILLLTPLITFLLDPQRSDLVVGLIYMLAIAAVGAAAWASRFPRYRVGLGALLVVISKLIAVPAGVGINDPGLIETSIWGFYYLGQFLICTGVIQTLRREST